MNNEERADAAQRAIEVATDSEWRIGGVAGLETDLADLLADLRHLCDRYGLEYGDLDAEAYRVYRGDLEDGPLVAARELPEPPSSQ